MWIFNCLWLFPAGLNINWLFFVWNVYGLYKAAIIRNIVKDIINNYNVIINNIY